jgi:hypothetical protein
MKSLLLALLIVTPLAAQAASPEETYFAARDKHIAKFTAIDEAGNLEEGALEDHQRARDELGKLLQPIIGPVAIKGIATKGTANVYSLFKGDEDFGLLDGLLYSSADDKTHVVVTTDALLDHWLKEHKDWWEPPLVNVPQDVNAALQSEAFYTQALMTDAAVFRYVDLPIAKPAKATLAFAMLVGRAQDIGPVTPGEIIVSVVGGGRAFVVSAPASVKVTPIAACGEIWRQAEKAAQARGGGAGAGSSDDNRSDETIRQEGDAAFHRCFAQRAKSQGFFAALVKQAQALVDRLPVR